MNLQRALYLILFLLGSMPLTAQRMDVKRHLGFDFTNQVDDILYYYNGLGVKITRDDVRKETLEPAKQEPVLVRFVSFRKTPPFLSVSTSFINVGAINGSIKIITIATNDLIGSMLMDSKLHRYSRGNVEVRENKGPKEIEWQFENCNVIKSLVWVKGDSDQYMKYDIIPKQ